MGKTPRYLFELTAQDIAAMLRAGNAEAGALVKIETNGDKLRIGVDVDALGGFIWAFYQAGGTTQSSYADACACASGI